MGWLPERCRLPVLAPLSPHSPPPPPPSRDPEGPPASLAFPSFLLEEKEGGHRVGVGCHAPHSWGPFSHSRGILE